MNTLQKIIIGILGVYIASVGAFVVFALTHQQNHSPNVGSIGTGDNYTSTTTTSAYASNSTTTPVLQHAGTLGSLIVASSSGTAFGLYDSAVGSTTAYGGAGTGTSTKIATFPAGIAAGTYTFDATVVRGLILDVPGGFNGVYTITFRNQ